jgi:hypothetical protein
VVITADELLDAAMRHVNAPGSRRLVRRLEVRHLAWLDQERAVATINAVVPGGAPLDLAAVFADGRRPAVSSTFTPITALWTSPRGGYWATLGLNGLQLYDRAGDSLNLLQLTDPHAVAWSPDETRMAVATRASIYVFPPGETRPFRRLDLVAGDLDWRGEAELTVSADTRQWISDLELSGRLFVTQGDGSDCALRAIQFPDLDWAEQAAQPSPCRFTLDESGVALPEGMVPQPGGDETATCLGAEGCAVAWRPDGRPTFVTGGELFAGKPDEGRSELLVSSARLRRIFGRPSALEEIAWYDDRRFWAVVRSGETALVALLSMTDDLVFSPSFTAREISGLQVSATGMVAARSDQGVVFFDSGGRRALTFPNGRAVAWAPGELIAAVATPSEVLFVAPVSREVVSLPLQVRDLAWVVP